MANIGVIVGEGFALLKRRPSAVLCWGAIYALGNAAIGYGQLRVASGQPYADRRWVEGLGVELAFALLSLVLSVVLSAAVFRAVLWPQDRGVASIRFGMDEVRLIGLTLILYVLGVLAGLVGGLGVGFLTSLAGLLAGGSTLFAGIFVPLILLGMLCLMAVVFVRLSVVFPLVLVRRRISLDAGWDLTRGHFWSLLGAYMLIGLSTIATLLLAMIPMFAIGIRLDEPTGTGWLSLLEQLRASGSASTPLLIIAVLLIGSLVSGIVLALWSGGVASATKDLLSRGEPRGLAGHDPAFVPLD